MVAVMVAVRTDAAGHPWTESRLRVVLSRLGPFRMGRARQRMVDMTGRRINGENSVYKSGGRWHVQGYINGGRQRVSRATRSEALEAWKSRVGGAVAPAPSRAPGQGRTVGHAVKEWLDQAQQGLSPSTSRGYHHALRAHIQPSLGDLPLSGLTVEAIERWQHRLLSGRGGRRPLSPSTVRQARVVLKHSSVEKPMVISTQPASERTGPTRVRCPRPRHTEHSPGPV